MKKYNGHSSAQNPYETHKYPNSSVLSRPFEIYQKKQEQPMQARSRSQLLIRSLPFVKRIDNTPQLPDFNQQIGTPLRNNFSSTPNQLMARNTNYFSNNNSNFINNNNNNPSNNGSQNNMTRSQVRFYVQNLGSGFQSSRKSYNASELMPQKIGSTRYAKPSPYSQPPSPSSSPQATASATAYRSTASNFPTFKTRFTATEEETNESGGKYPLKTTNFEETTNIFGDTTKNYRTENNELLNQDPYYEGANSNGQQFFLNRNNNQAFSETQKQFFENFMQETKPIVSNNTPVMSEAAISEEYPFKFQADIGSLENPNSSIPFLNGFPHNLPFIENTLRAASKARDELIATKETLKQEINDLQANFEAQILEFTEETAYLASKVSLEIKSDFAQQQTKQFALSKELVKLVKDKMKLESDLDQQLVKARRLEEKLLGKEVFNVEPIDETFKNITCNNLRSDSFSPFSTQAQQQIFQSKMLH